MLLLGGAAVPVVADEPAPADPDGSAGEVEVTLLDPHGEPLDQEPVHAHPVGQPDDDLAVGGGDGRAETDPAGGITFDLDGLDDDRIEVHTPAGSDTEVETSELDGATLHLAADVWGTVIGPDGSAPPGVEVYGWGDGDLDDPDLDSAEDWEVAFQWADDGRFVFHAWDDDEDEQTRGDGDLGIDHLGAFGEGQMPAVEEAGAGVELVLHDRIPLDVSSVLPAGLDTLTVTALDTSGDPLAAVRLGDDRRTQFAAVDGPQPQPLGADEGQALALFVGEDLAGLEVAGPDGATDTIELDGVTEQGVEVVVGAVEVLDTATGDGLDDATTQLRLGEDIEDPDAPAGDLLDLVDATTADGLAVGVVRRDADGPSFTDGAQAIVDADAPGYEPSGPQLLELAGVDGGGLLGALRHEGLTLELEAEDTGEPDPDPDPGPPPAPDPEPEPASAVVRVVDADTGVAIQGAHVALTGDGAPPATVTDVAGDATFTGFDAGDYTVEVTGVGDAAASGSLTADAGQRTDLTVELASPSVPLWVTVTDPDEGPVSGAEVTADGVADDPIVLAGLVEPSAGLVPSTVTDPALAATTDADGLADLGDAPPGEYEITVEADGHEATTITHTVVVGDLAEPVAVTVEPDTDLDEAPSDEPGEDGVGSPSDEAGGEGDGSPSDGSGDGDDGPRPGGTDDGGDTEAETSPDATQGPGADSSDVDVRDREPSAPAPAPSAPTGSGQASDDGATAAGEVGDTEPDDGAATRGDAAGSDDPSSSGDPSGSGDAPGSGDGPGSGDTAGSDRAPDPDEAPAAAGAERLGELAAADRADEVPAITRGSIQPDTVGTFGTGVPTAAHGPLQTDRVTTNIWLAALLALLLIIPAELFNATLRENYERVTAPLGGARTYARDVLTRLAATVPFARVAGGVLFTVVVAIAASMLDPGFGFSLGSLRLMAAQTVGLVVTTYAVSGIALLLAGRQGVPASMAFRPAALIVVVAVVLASRAVDLSPGFLYGFVAAAQFHRQITVRQLGRITLAQAVFMLTAGVGAWFVLAPAQAAAADGGFVAALSAEALTAVSVGSLTSLVIAFLPLTFTHGERLFLWSRAAWLGIYALGLFAFLSVAANPVFGQLPATGSLGLALGAYATFGLGCVAFWYYFRRTETRDASERITAPAGHS